MILVKAVAQHIHRALVHPEHLPIPLEFQPQGLEVGGDLLPGLVQFPLGRAEQHHIIHIAQSIPDAKLLLDVVIQSLQVKVGQPLRGVVPDGQPLRIAVDDGVQQGKNLLILDFPPKHGLELLMADVLVKFPHIQLEAVFCVFVVSG